MAIQENNAWATDNIPYNDKDWTLKSAYSYSLLYELLGYKYRLHKSYNLVSTKVDDIDAIFFMTPTKIFTDEEKFILDKYLKNGGKIIFIADHTDLYGHARAINSFIASYGLKIRYDAVFVPHEKHAKALIENFVSPKIRMMTSSSISVSPFTATVAFCHRFIAENADYTRPNFFAEMRDTPDDKYGTFPLVTTTNVGRGQIVLCTESTVFSNFGIFQPNVLKLLDLVFDDLRLSSWIALISMPIFILAILLLFLKNGLYRVMAFLLLLILTRTFYIYWDTTLDYYDKSKLLIVKSDEKYIFEPYFETIDQSADSVSYLFSAIPRYGLYPYFVNNLSFIPNNNIDLYINDCSYAKKLLPGQKLLSTNYCESERNDVNIIPDSLSDYRLGNWWAQIDVSPYRKDRVKSFSEWIKIDKPILDFIYPEMIKDGFGLPLSLINDRGERYVININPVKVNSTPIGGYILIDDGVWCMKTKNGDSTILIGGDSFNDRRNIPFFSRYWFVEVPDGIAK